MIPFFETFLKLSPAILLPLLLVSYADNPPGCLRWIVIILLAMFVLMMAIGMVVVS